MASEIEDSLSQTAGWLQGLWAEATDYLTAREERKATEARYANGINGGIAGGTAATGTWTNPDQAAIDAAMGGGSSKYQNLMLLLSFAGVVVGLLAFIRR